MTWSKISKLGKLEDTLFKVPADYKKMQMPDIGSDAPVKSALSLFHSCCRLHCIRQQVWFQNGSWPDYFFAQK